MKYLFEYINGIFIKYFLFFFYIKKQKSIYSKKIKNYYYFFCNFHHLSEIIGETPHNSTLETIEEDNEEMLDDSITMDNLIERLRKNDFENILVLVGAGISTSAGIPGTRVYRTPHPLV